MAKGHTYIYYIVMALLTAVASAYEIKTRENAPAYERTAAEELRGYLAKLVAPGGKVTVNGKTIDAFYVGDTEFAGGKGMASSQFAEEAWRIRAFEGNVVLNGGGSRGALYAVFHFLEDFCGVRWMTFDEEYVPAPVGTLSLPPLDVSGKPKLLYRCIYAASNLDKELGMQVVRHAVRNRMNHLGDYRIPSEWGGGFDYGTPYHCHTMDDYYVPAKEYLATKPELFSLLNGKRVGGQFVGQLCLSNPEVYEIYRKKLLDTIISDREKADAEGRVYPRIYDLSQNDNGFHCQCKDCEALAAKYGQSGVYLLLINKLAEDVAKKYPDIYLSILAYIHTEEAPKGGIKAAPNVIVKLCDTRSNFAAAVEDDNGIHFKNIRDWEDKCSTLFIWDYAQTFLPSGAGFPLPNEFRADSLYKFYYNHKVRGLFWELGRNPLTADFYPLKVFLHTKMMEDPERDAAKVIQDFIGKYYGAAADEMTAFRKIVDEARRKTGCMVTMSAPVTDYYFMGVPEQEKAQGLFDAAEKKAAGNPVLMRRLREARLPLDRLACRYGIGFQLSTPESIPKALPKPLVAAARKRLEAPEVIANLERYPSMKNSEALNTFKTEKSLYAANDAVIRPSSKFAGIPHYDFTVFLMGNLDPSGTIQCVQDPLSEAGCVWRHDPQNNYYKLPMIIGHYDKVTLRNAMPDFQFGKEMLPPEGKYQWYNAGKLRVPPQRNYIYINRCWTIQTSLDIAELHNRLFDVWVSMKFTGKEYYPDSKEEKSYVWVERMVLVPMEDK